MLTDTPVKAELERQDLLRKTTVKAKARAATKQKTSKKQPKFNKSSADLEIDRGVICVIVTSVTDFMIFITCYISVTF